MIRVSARAGRTAEWKKWVKDGAAAVARHHRESAAGTRILFEERLYKNYKKALLAVFTGKCAYCESSIKENQPGDVEHFRPKAAVTDHDHLPVRVNGRAHPGYFWLVYDWENLLISCALCNRLVIDDDGIRQGKMNRFPVLGTHAMRPEEVAEEKPLLINPRRENPEKHLDLAPDTGVLLARGIRGEVSIKVFGLNRDGLPQARRREYENVRAHIVTLGAALDSGDKKLIESSLALLREHADGRGPYSLVGRRAISDNQKAIDRLLARLGGGRRRGAR